MTVEFFLLSVYFLQMAQYNTIQIGQYFLTMYFIAFDFIVLSDLKFNPNNFIEIYSLGFFQLIV